MRCGRERRQLYESLNPFRPIGLPMSGVFLQISRMQTQAPKWLIDAAKLSTKKLQSKADALEFRAAVLREVLRRRQSQSGPRARVFLRLCWPQRQPSS